MAENVFTQRFCDIVKKQICTTTAELNFDTYTTAGTYEIYESIGNGLNRVYFLTVDKSAGGHCTQTRTYCGKVEYRSCSASGTWTEWESKTGSGGSSGSGEDGGYYIPSITQLDDITALVTFSPSKSDMPAVDNTALILPRGADGYTPVRGTDYWTEADKAEIKADVIKSFVNAEGVAY